MRLFSSCTGIGLLAVLALPAAAAQEAGGDTAEARPDGGGETLFIRADRVIVRPGKVLEDAGVLVEDGVIVAVGADLAAPSDARQIRGKVVCAGFVDAWGALGVTSDALGDDDTDAASRTVDALNLYSSDHLRLEALKAGVTAARVQAGNRAAVSGIGAVVRLRPGLDPDEAVLLEDASLGMSAGLSRQRSTGFGGGSMVSADPFDRIDQVDKIAGLIEAGRSYAEDMVEYGYDLEEWQKAIAEKEEELEKDFKKAKKARDKAQKDAEEKDKEFKEKKYKEDKKPRPPKYDAEKESLGRIANGELPLVVQVHRASEVRALLAATEKFDRLRLIVAGGTEALCGTDELVARKVPVIVWPALRGTGGVDEFAGHDLALAARLHEAGVQVLLGTGGASWEASRDLPLLASLAVGHGLDREAALEALTTGAARALDVADRIGSLQRGKDADLLVLDGDPLVSTTRVRWVISAGSVVVTPED